MTVLAAGRLLGARGVGFGVRLAEVVVHGSPPPVTSTTTAAAVGAAEASLSEGAAAALDEGELGALAGTEAPRVIMLSWEG
ncbi:unnamed protein product [Phytophthora lilii]|uniref:Unnamed protein product n=1 Tax=Phytophthora lilii TaxID=2077276 RepID=A0A9W6TQM3_9STRA|nr:unnamed protein product [Phytophthora lilii]